MGRKGATLVLPSYSRHDRARTSAVMLVWLNEKSHKSVIQKRL